MNSPRAWYAPASASRRRHRVGAAAETWATYKEASAAQEQAAIDLKEPISASWVMLKRGLIEIADDLGVGPEVAEMFEVLKAGTALNSAALAAAPGGAAAATAGLGIGAGVAAGVVGGLVLAAISIFGDSDEESEAAYQKRKAAYRADLQQLLDEPTLEGLAHEADVRAGQAASGASTASQLGWDSGPFARARDASHRLAVFYRRVAQTLSPSEQYLFLSAAWSARLASTRGWYDALPQFDPKSPVRVRVAWAFPDFSARLVDAEGAAKKKFAHAASQPTTPQLTLSPGLLGGLGGALGSEPDALSRVVSGALTVGVLGVIALSGLWLVRPALATRVAETAARSGKSLALGATRAVLPAARSVSTGVSRLARRVVGLKGS